MGIGSGVVGRGVVGNCFGATFSVDGRGVVVGNGFGATFSVDKGCAVVVLLFRDSTSDVGGGNVV